MHILLNLTLKDGIVAFNSIIIIDEVLKALKIFLNANNF